MKLNLCSKQLPNQDAEGIKGLYKNCNNARNIFANLHSYRIRSKYSNGLNSSIPSVSLFF